VKVKINIIKINIKRKTFLIFIFITKKRGK
jgi:hypothetical protein